MLTAGGAHARLRGFPDASLDALLGAGRALVLAPHADDESLGCGGLIAAACGAGRPPLVAFLTDGCGSHPNSAAFPAARLRATREAEAREAGAILGLGATDLAFLGAPDTALAAHAGTVVARLLVVADGAGPIGTVFATWPHDPHGDHVAAASIGMRVAAALGARLLFYPVWGWTLPAEAALPGPPPEGWRLDIRPQLARKRAAIAAHRSQLGGLVTDDPAGFTLPPGFVDLLCGPAEVFIEGGGGG